MTEFQYVPPALKELREIKQLLEQIVGLLNEIARNTGVKYDVR